MCKQVIICVSLLLLAASPCWASPSGLNNIPTTDVVGDKTLVIQGWLTMEDEVKPLYITGFKYGILDMVELGLDSKVGSDDEGPIALQGKLKLIDFDFGLSALIGTEGVTFDGKIDENIVPYATISQDLKFLRLHLGYNFQKDNFGVFSGVDKTIRLFGDQDLTLRSDVKQVNDGENFLISCGFLLTLPFNLALESWLSMPTKDDAEESVTVKLNYIIQF